MMIIQSHEMHAVRIHSSVSNCDANLLGRLMSTLSPKLVVASLEAQVFEQLLLKVRVCDNALA